MLWMTALALAGSPVQEPDHSEFGCAFHSRKKEDTGALHIYANCHWPTVSVSSLDAVLYDFKGQTKMYRNMTINEVLRRTESTAILRQVHTHPMISPREGVIEWRREERAGKVTHEYSLIDTQPDPAPGNVSMNVHLGFWVLEDHPNGGVKVTYEAGYLAGLYLPDFLMNRFQASTMYDTVGDVYAYAMQRQ
jgi:hypothetical protein